MKKFFSLTVGVRRIQAPFLVFSLLLLAGLAFFSVAAEDFSGKSIFQDVDQDGLTHEEELLYRTDPQKSDTDGDGYSDGAEVRSGYDPLKPAPGDRILSSRKEINGKSERVSGSSVSPDGDTRQGSFRVGTDGVGGTDSANLTTQVSEQIADILKSASAEENGGGLPSLEAIQENVQALLDKQNIDDLELPDVSGEEIKIKKQAYDDLSDEERKAAIKEDTLEYVTKVAYVVVSNAPEPITEPEEAKKLTEALMKDVTTSIETGDTKLLKDLTENGDRVLLELREIEVPENMLESHRKAIQLFLYASTLPQELDSLQSDPLSGAVALSKIQGLIGAVSSFVKDIDSSLEDIGIEKDEIPLDL